VGECSLPAAREPAQRTAPPARLRRGAGERQAPNARGWVGGRERAPVPGRAAGEGIAKRGGEGSFSRSESEKKTVPRSRGRAVATTPATRKWVQEKHDSPNTPMPQYMCGARCLHPAPRIHPFIPFIYACCVCPFVPHSSKFRFANLRVVSAVFGV